MHEGIRGAIRRLEVGTKLIIKDLNVAIQNEQITRQRVDTVEQQVLILRAILARGFFGRLKWLIVGR